MFAYVRCENTGACVCVVVVWLCVVVCVLLCVCVCVFVCVVCCVLCVVCVCYKSSKEAELEANCCYPGHS